MCRHCDLFGKVPSLCLLQFSSGKMWMRTLSSQLTVRIEQHRVDQGPGTDARRERVTGLQQWQFPSYLATGRDWRSGVKKTLFSKNISPDRCQYLKFNHKEIPFGFSKAPIKCQIICHYCVYWSFRGNLSQSKSNKNSYDSEKTGKGLWRVTTEWGGWQNKKKISKQFLETNLLCFIMILAVSLI